MRTMSAKDAKNHFGELLMEAQRAPVTIEKNGKPVAVVYSFEEHHHIEAAKLEWLKAAVAEGVADLEAGRSAELSDELVAQIKAARSVAFGRSRLILDVAADHFSPSAARPAANLALRCGAERSRACRRFDRPHPRRQRVVCRCSLRPVSSHPETRASSPVVRLAGSTSIFYRPRAATIEIIRVIHGRRDVPSAWDEPDLAARPR